MRFHIDRFGFPLVEFEGIAKLSLLPITKYQYERFLSEKGEPCQNHYDDLLRISQRVSWRSFNENNFEFLFVGGIFPQEALEFAKYVGSDYDLPSANGWKLCANLLKQHSLNEFKYFFLNKKNFFCPAAQNIIQFILNRKNYKTLYHLSLFEGGMLEWVKIGSEYAVLGKPRNSFLHNTYNPIIDDPIRVVTNERLYYIGFRIFSEFT